MSTEQNITKIFQHPKGKNTVLDSSKGKVVTVTDIIGRTGTFQTSDVALIDLLTSAKWKELPAINEDEVKKARKSTIPEGIYMFQSTEHFNKKVETSAGAAEFDKNGLAKVDAKTAAVLLAAGYTPTDETKLKLVKAGVINIETNETLDLSKIIPIKKVDTGKTEITQQPATGMISGTGTQSKAPEMPLEELVKTLTPEQKDEFSELTENAGMTAEQQAIDAGKSEEEATQAGNEAAEKAGREFIASLKIAKADPLEALNEDQLIEICINRKIELPDKKTKKNMIKAINAAGVKK